MALKRLVIEGFGQLELNNVAFRRDGRIEAQCALDSTDFASVPAENGMLLAVDNVNRVVKFADDASLPIALNYTTEHYLCQEKVSKIYRSKEISKLQYQPVYNTEAKQKLF